MQAVQFHSLHGVDEKPPGIYKAKIGMGQKYWKGEAVHAPLGHEKTGQDKRNTTARYASTAPFSSGLVDEGRQYDQRAAKRTS